ncbi:hypothetical protein Tco_0608085 [Tanacetum coccineum]
MPSPNTKTPYIKPPIEKKLGFIKTLGYDEDPKEKMNFVSTFVSTRLHQPWRAILSVLNRSLIGKDSSWDTARLPILQILWGIVDSVNLDFASLIWKEFEWQTVDRSTKPSKMSKLLYTRFTKLIIDYFLSCNKNIPRRLDSEMHSKCDDSPLTKLSNTVKGTYKFIMEIPNTMINEAFKQSTRYKYYKENGNGYSLKDKNKAKTNKTEHGIGKSCMQTRSSSKFVGEPSTNPTSTIPKRRNHRRSIERVEPFSLVETPVFYKIASTRYLLQWLKPILSRFFEFFRWWQSFERSTQDVLKIIENKSKVCYSRNKPIVSQVKASNVDSSEIASVVTSAMTAMFKQHQVTLASASVKAVEESCVTCGGAHSYRQCPAIDGNTFSGYQDNIQGYVSAAAVNYNQGNTGFRPQNVANQIRPPGFSQPNVQNNQTRYNQGYNQNRGINQGNQNYQAPVYQEPIHQPQVVTTSDFSNYIKANDAVMKNMQTQMTSLTNSNIKLKNMFGQFMKVNTASTSGSGSLPSNTVANTRGGLKAITTRSGISYDGPPILPPSSSLSKVVEREPEVTKDTVQPSTKNIQPPVVQIQAPIDELVVAPKPKPTIPYPSRANKKLHVEISFADALLHMPKFATMFKSLLNNKEKLFELANTTSSINRIDVIDVAYGEYAQEVLGFSEISTSGNPTSEPIISTSSPTLTLFDDSDFLLEEIDAFLAIEDDLISPEIDNSYYDSEGDICLLEEFLNDDPSSSLPPQELRFVEPKTEKSSIDDPPELELKDLPSHLEYAFLEGTDKLPVIIAKDLKEDEKVRLLKALKSHKRAITWKISDIKGIGPQFCTHKILMEDDSKPAIQHQRRVNLKIHEVIKKEVIKLLDVGLIYPISEGLWVTPFIVCPRKADTFKFLLTRKTKRRPPSLALMGRLPSDACLSAYVMLRARSKGA